MDTAYSFQQNKDTFYERQELRKEFWVDYQVADCCLEQLFFLLLLPGFSKNRRKNMYSRMRTAHSIRQGKRESISDHLNHYKSTAPRDMQLTHRQLGMLLTGGTNNGKTSILLRFKELVEQHDLRRSVIPTSDENVISLRPIVNIDTPPSKISTLLKEILDDIGAPYNYRENVDDLMRRVIIGLKTAKVRVLMLDEFQNVLDVRGLILPDLMNKLVYISN